MLTESSIDEVLEALRAGRPVLVLDDIDRENEGDVVLAAQTATPEWMAWTIRRSSGYVCAPMTEALADRLALPLMVERNEDTLRTAYTVTVDAAAGVTTGISATDRTTTLRVLADPASTPADLIRPGHVVPLRARDGGVLVRRGHTEAAVDLCRLAGLAPVGAIGELVHDSGEMMRTPEVFALGEQMSLPVITIASLVEHRLRHDRVVRQARTVVPTRHGAFTTYGYSDPLSGAEHIALVSPLGLGETPLVRVHSECLTGDAFGSLRCDCGPQLEQALERVAREGGAVVYVRGHEGRGVGLLAKLAAYHEQDGGADTVEAQERLGLPVDARDYDAAAAIVHDLGVTRLRLITNNPAKVDALTARGLDVAAVEASIVSPNPANAAYLRTKRERMGHLLPADNPTLAQEA